MAALRPLAGEEVPILGSDNINWISLTVPSSSPPSSPLSDNAGARDLAGCHVINGESPAYLIWRVHKNLPNVLEVFEVSPWNQFPSNGVKLVFKETLYPFSFIYKNEVHSGSRSVYSVYAVTLSGCGYLCNIQSPSCYSQGSIPAIETFEINVKNNAQSGQISAVTATSGCLVLARLDGSITCYRLGKLKPKSPGFSYELSDDAVIGRLWNLVSRARIVGAVQDLVISEVYERKLLFSIHKDGFLRVWDLFNRTRLLCFNFSTFEPQGINPSKVWVGLVDSEKEMINVAILHQGVLEQESDRLSVYNFDLNADDNLLFSAEPSRYDVPLGEGKVVDMKMSTSNLRMLKQIGSIQYELIEFDCETETTCFYTLQEENVSKQLFQTSENGSLDDLLWTNDTLLSALKDEATNFISSIFMRRLMQPEVYQSSALRETFLDYNKFLSESQFNSLSFSGIKNEILGIIQRQGGSKNPDLSVYYWKDFCSRFIQHHFENTVPYAIFLDFENNNSFGLIRKGSISIFRLLDHAEHLIHGPSDNIGSHLSDASIDSQLLGEILNCIYHLKNHLGEASCGLYQESLISQVISSDDIICQLVKVLEGGFTISSPESLISQIGSDAYLAKQKLAHKKQRKFSADILLALNSLSFRATSWEQVFKVIEKYVKQLSVQSFSSENSEFKSGFSVNCSVLVQASSQIAEKMFESAFGVLLILSYLVEISGQVLLTQADIARIKLRLIPIVEETILQWLIIHFVGTTRPSLDDFSSQLSSLNIGNGDKMSLRQITLACLLEFPSLESLSSSFLNPKDIISFANKFSSSIIWRKNDSSILSGLTSYLVPILLRHSQFEAAESLLSIVDTYSRNKKEIGTNDDKEWCAQMHLRGFCLFMLANNELDSVLKQQKIHESIRCFFRAASVQCAPQALQSFSSETGLHYSGGSGSIAAWRVRYYQWAYQLLENSNIHEGACRFAIAALEQLDKTSDADLSESASTIQGKLWDNVYSCSMHLKRYRDAYAAITSNPNLNDQYGLLTRFVRTLCETGATKVLCDGEIPFIGLVGRVEKAILDKAKHVDISAKPNLYKVLYAFEAQRNNWRKAASFMYQYTTRLKKKLNHLEMHNNSSQISSVLEEILNALSCSLNALHLVDPTYAWLELSSQDNLESGLVSELHDSKYCVDIEGLEKEYILASAQKLLCLRYNKFKISGSKNLSNLVDVLIHENLYDAAFTVILKFWKGSAMKRELERAFVSIAQDCCVNRKASSRGNLKKSSYLLLQSSADDNNNMDEDMQESPITQQFKGNGHWDTLQHYLEKYRKLHGRLPVIVAETLLYTDPFIELPLWLVHMFKDGRNTKCWGMAGQESDAAMLFRLYINYGRYAKATNLLLEYLDSYASLRPADVMDRKKMSAVWFPYTGIHQLLCDLEDMQNAGHDEDQCHHLKTLLTAALATHLKQIEMDSEDVLSSMPEQEQEEEEEE